MTVTPAEWFDQFPPLPPGTDWPEQTACCWRHWAPCSQLHANGVGATGELRAIWARELAPKGSYSPAARARQYAAAARICCQLGDDRMHQLWARWLPTPKEDT